MWVFDRTVYSSSWYLRPRYAGTAQRGSAGARGVPGLRRLYQREGPLSLGMASPASRSLPRMPRLLKATYLAENEALLRETRATRLHYFPGPIFGLLVFAVLDYSAAAARFAIPGLGALTDAFRRLFDLSVYGMYGIFGFLGLVTLILLLWLAVRYFRWISRVYAITSNRVIVQRGVIGRDFEEIPLNQIRGVDVRQTGWQRLLRYGSIYVSSELGHIVREGVDPTGNEEWQGIPRPFEFQRIIEAATQNLVRGQSGAGPFPPAPVR